MAGTSKPPDIRPHGPTSAMAGRPDDISESELARFVAGLPQAYQVVFEPATIYAHVRLARGMQPHDLHAAMDQHESARALTVVASDSPLLLCNIAAVLTYFGMDIRQGRAITTPAGLVLAELEFTDPEGFIGGHRGGLRRIRRMLEAAAAGSVDMIELMRNQARARRPDLETHAPPSIEATRSSSDDSTVVHIVADDAPGLLYRISRVIVHAGCTIDLAIISTEQGQAIDTLHVTRGTRALPEADAALLRQDLERVLAPGRGW